jgi:hypothetical protein
MFIKPSQKAGIVVAGNGQTQVGSQKQYLTTIQTEKTELNRELMRPGEK